MKLMLMAALAFVGFTAMPSRVAAQMGDARLIAPGPQALRAAAELRLAAPEPAGLQVPVGARMMQASSGNRRQGEIMMIVGAAGIVTGLLVDEDLVTIAGAAVGGFGLYLYLQGTR